MLEQLLHRHHCRDRHLVSPPGGHASRRAVRHEVGREGRHLQRQLAHPYVVVIRPCSSAHRRRSVRVLARPRRGAVPCGCRRAQRVLVVDVDRSAVVRRVDGAVDLVVRSRVAPQALVHHALAGDRRAEGHDRHRIRARRAHPCESRPVVHPHGVVGPRSRRACVRHRRLVDVRGAREHGSCGRRQRGHECYCKQ